MYISISVTIFLCLCLGVEGQQILSATRPSPKSNLRSVNKGNFINVAVKKKQTYVSLTLYIPLPFFYNKLMTISSDNKYT